MEPDKAPDIWLLVLDIVTDVKVFHGFSNWSYNKIFKVKSMNASGDVSDEVTIIRLSLIASTSK